VLSYCNTVNELCTDLRPVVKANKKMLYEYDFFGRGNGSLMAKNVDVVVVVESCSCYQIFYSLRLCRFSTDRNETFHSY